MANEKYWKDSLEEVFSHHGIELTDEIAEDIIQVADMESEATGAAYFQRDDSAERALKKQVEELKNSMREKEELILKAHARKSGTRNEWSAYTFDRDGNIVLNGRGIS